MDEFLKQLLLDAPNFAVAIMTIFWSFRRMDTRDQQEAKLIDALLQMCIENSKLQQQQQPPDATPRV